MVGIGNRCVDPVFFLVLVVQNAQYHVVSDVQASERTDRSYHSYWIIKT